MNKMQPISIPGASYLHQEVDQLSDSPGIGFLFVPPLTHRVGDSAGMIKYHICISQDLISVTTATRIV